MVACLKLSFNVNKPLCLCLHTSLLFVYLIARQFVYFYLFINLSVSLLIRLLIDLSIDLSVCISVYLSVHIHICLFLTLFFHPSKRRLCVCDCLSVCLPVLASTDVCVDALACLYTRVWSIKSIDRYLGPFLHGPPLV